MYTLYEQIQKESVRLQEQINSISNQLQSFPKEQIFCSRTGKYYKWYATDGKNQVYIPKKNRKYAEKLALKKYLQLRLEKLEKEQKAINYYLKYHVEDNRAEELLTSRPEYQELLSPYFTPISTELEQWMNEPYERCKKHPENLKYKTISGNFVRSKSEALIEMYLFHNRIPFRYEAPFILGSQIIYPDFTIRHPKTGEFFYWEHFGKMDDLGYIRKASYKIQQYSTYGIVPSIQLITTYETKDKPLNTGEVEEIIRKYFLD